MIVMLVTSSSFAESRRIQDEVLVTGETGDPMFIIEYVAVRIPTSVTVFCDVMHDRLLRDSRVNFVLCDDPLREAIGRLRT